MAALLTAGLLTAVASAVGATTDLGAEGPSYAGAYLEPSGSKPQSKLWFHDGSWWGVLFHSPSRTFRIHQLDRAAARWVDTGAVIDVRVNSRADALWDGSKLYVASHRYSVTAETGFPARLYRLSYDAAARRFVHDAGFPTQINNVKTESLVIDKDSTGRLWATWNYGSRIYVNHTIGGDATWGTPFILPGIGTSVATDDISAVVAFGGDKVGVLWGNQQASAYYFAVHRDVDPPGTWTTEAALTGAGMADDHLNIKAAANGTLFAAVKTSKSGDADPLVVLLTRHLDGMWRPSTVALNRDSHTRPIVQLDESQRMLHVLMTGPQPPSTTGQKGGDIYLKSSPMDAVAFDAGLGTPVIRDAGNATMNNVSSTKQPVSAESGLVALASTEGTDRYWHADLDLGSRESVPTSTTTSTSTTSTSTTSTSTTSTSTTSTTAPPPTTTTTMPTTTTTTQPASTTAVVPVYGDSYVRSAAATTRYGGSTFLRVQAASTADVYQSHLAFDVPATIGTVRSAKLRLYVLGGSGDSGTVHVTEGTWDEWTVTWSTAPALGRAVATLGRTADATWVEVDVTSAVVAGQRIGLGVRNNSGDGAYFSSREGSNPPQLVITGD